MVINTRKIVLIIGAALVVASIIASITILIIKNNNKKPQDNVSSGSTQSEYTESEIEEIKDWWSSAVIEQEDGQPIESIN